MANHFDYTEKFNSFRGGTIYEKLTPEQQIFIREVAFSHRLTFQEFRQVVEASRDLAIWGEADLRPWWKEQASQTNGNGIRSKKQILQNLQTHLNNLRNTLKKYPVEGLYKPKKREKNKIVTEKSNKKV
jgi:hypothetical protein